MFLKGTLFKIETGQKLSKRQIKKLATKMQLIPSALRTIFLALMFIALFVFLLLGFLSNSITNKIIFYIISGVIFVAIIIIMVFLKLFLVKKYLQTVEKFYETKFRDYQDFDMFYLGHHINPHLKILQTKKIYLLTDGYHFIFIEDYFKDAEFAMPKAFSFNKEQVYLRVINENVSDDSRVIIRLEEIEHFYITNENFAAMEEQNKKNYKYYKWFFSQKTMMEESVVVLKMTNGLIFRLAPEIYAVFKEVMPTKEKL